MSVELSVQGREGFESVCETLHRWLFVATISVCDGYDTVCHCMLLSDSYW